ncbi:hypothetical protein CN085_27615 [Sinorhizobium meliloti]|uniref:hypothetical protein n=1 Tax=Rhizobium meliloti TaxID=382 RepID=UPI000FDC1183|nr:hypothetical protein [Sinorhizobium meliloti]RVP09917.1 hypothetical protein CN085_27615 [Sinorhizobium meliloti]
MKNPAPISLVTAALLLAALPLMRRAQDQDRENQPIAGAPDDDQRLASSVVGVPAVGAAADRLDDLRNDFSDTVIRFRLASMLSVQQTAIGIRADQQDAWRAYTQALLALVPDREAVTVLICAPDENLKGPEALIHAEALSIIVAGYTDKAQVLAKAVDDLRARLTPEQLKTARIPQLI